MIHIAPCTEADVLKKLQHAKIRYRPMKKLDLERQVVFSYLKVITARVGSSISKMHLHVHVLYPITSIFPSPHENQISIVPVRRNNLIKTPSQPT